MSSETPSSYHGMLDRAQIAAIKAKNGGGGFGGGGGGGGRGGGRRGGGGRGVAPKAHGPSKQKPTVDPLAKEHTKFDAATRKAKHDTTKLHEKHKSGNDKAIAKSQKDADKRQAVATKKAEAGHRKHKAGGHVAHMHKPHSPVKALKEVAKEVVKAGVAASGQHQTIEAVEESAKHKK